MHSLQFSHSSLEMQGCTPVTIEGLPQKINFKKRKWWNIQGKIGLPKLLTLRGRKPYLSIRLDSCYYFNKRQCIKGA